VGRQKTEIRQKPAALRGEKGTGQDPRFQILHRTAGWGATQANVWGDTGGKKRAEQMKGGPTTAETFSRGRGGAREGVWKGPFLGTTYCALGLIISWFGGK